MTAKEKLIARREIDGNGCWIKRGLSPKRYGQTYFDGAYYPTHRLSYVAFIGPIPDGHFVCHKCDVPGCYNPEHLFTGTQKENMADMEAKGRAVRRKFDPGYVCKIRVNVTIPSDIHALGVSLAKADQRSFSSYVECLIASEAQRRKAA